MRARRREVAISISIFGNFKIYFRPFLVVIYVHALHNYSYSRRSLFYNKGDTF